MLDRTVSTLNLLPAPDLSPDVAQTTIALSTETAQLVKEQLLWEATLRNQQLLMVSSSWQQTQIHLSPRVKHGLVV